MPGLTLNLGRKSVSASVGRRGAWLTFRPGHNARMTVGLPGTGLRSTQGGEPQTQAPAPEADGTAATASPRRGRSWIGAILLIVLVLVVERGGR